MSCFKTLARPPVLPGRLSTAFCFSEQGIYLTTALATSRQTSRDCSSLDALGCAGGGETLVVERGDVQRCESLLQTCSCNCQQRAGFAG